MITEKSTIKTEIVYSDDRKHRYVLRKIWDSALPSAGIVMLSPSISNAISQDMTTTYIINRLNELGYGSVNILNIFSALDDVDMDTDKDNDDFIVKSAQKDDVFIVAWGKGNQNSKDIVLRQEEVLTLLKPFEGKLKLIGDSSGNAGFHPLGSAVRLKWVLMPYESAQKTKKE